MKYDTCIAQLRTLLDATDPDTPVDPTDVVQNFAAAYTLVYWFTRHDEKAREQFEVFLSYFELFAFNPDGQKEISRHACEEELIKLLMNLPKE